MQADSLKRDLWSVLGNYPGRLKPADYQHVFSELAAKAKDESLFAPYYDDGNG